MSQAALTQNPPFVLNTTKGGGKVCRWPRYASIHMDVRPQTRPDIVADARYLPFRTGIFDKLYCDPPHIVRTSKVSGMEDIYERYGHWKTRSDWLEFVEATNKEFARVLATGGKLEYKVTDGSVWKGETGGATHLFELIKGMTDFEIIRDRITDSLNHVMNSRSKVHWLTMKPLDQPGDVE